MSIESGPVAGKDYPRTYQQFLEWFNDEAACRRYVLRCRWPEGFECGRCGAKAEPWTTTRGYLHCRECGSELSVTAGTIFERTRLPLKTWFAAIGFEEVEVTARSKDGGIDVRGTLVVGGVIRTRLAVQVKRWKQNVQSPVIQQVRGSLGAHEQGLVISTSDFGKGAKQEAERPDATPVALMNGEQLVALLVEHEIGVRRTAFSLVELGEDNGEPLEASDA